jgi:hypothetical protein
LTNKVPTRQVPEKYKFGLAIYKHSGYYLSIHSILETFFIFLLTKLILMPAGEGAFEA